MSNPTAQHTPGPLYDPHRIDHRCGVCGVNHKPRIPGDPHPCVDALLGERDRLRALNAELVKALEKIEHSTKVAKEWGHHGEPDKALVGIENYHQIARAAIARAKGAA